jgi:uncharacterized BrkB/YihY/UPF0761 family membrane protein
VARVAAWGKATAERASTWAVGARATHPSVDVGFRLADRDKRAAAGVLAGGVAYRLFFWILSVSLLATGAFGFADGEWVEDTLTELGIGPLISEFAKDLSQQSQEARWWLLLVGGWLVLWTGYLGAKALVLVHAAIWGVTPPTVRGRLWVSLAFTGSVLALLASMSLTRRLHSESAVLGVAATLVLAVVPFGLWLLASRWLPHRGTGIRELVPGAVVMAVGIQAIFLFTALFLAPKLASATQMYGVIGIVSTLLFWLYLLGRLVVGGATLDASYYEHRSGTTTQSTW